MSMTQCLFRDDPYLSTVGAKVLDVNERGGIILDQTVFYATSGGQPGDVGFLERIDGTKIAVSATVCGENKDDIIHLAAPNHELPDIGETLILHVDWPRRHKLMRMHTACHLLTVVCPYPITGASIGEDESRIDFDMQELPFDKVQASVSMMELINANYPIFTRLISQDDLAKKPDLVKSKNVKPPSDSDQIRLVCIGEDGAIDSQPCGGTHVSETAEIGEIHIGKIEKKGKENRRFRLRFGPLPA